MRQTQEFLAAVETKLVAEGKIATGRKKKRKWEGWELSCPDCTTLCKISSSCQPNGKFKGSFLRWV